jgi:serine phosphatase RsbU (regulator of sigma subunit)
MKMNSNDLEIHLSQLSHIRHEMSNPINSIIGYSSLILEILEDEDLILEGYGDNEIQLQEIQSQLVDGLTFIQDQGENILLLVRTIFSSDDADNHFSSLEDRLKLFKTKMGNKLQKIVEVCNKLLQIPAQDINGDIKKIHQATQNLILMIEDYFTWSKNQQINLKFQFNANLKPEISIETPPVLTPITTTKINLGKEISKSGKKQHLPTEENNPLHCHILVVDDNENNRELLSRRIRDQGYQVITAKNGKEAIKEINKGNYDLIILDIIMPEIDGYQVLKWLKDSQWRNIPVIMISALDELDSVVKCIEMGAEDYLQKPFNPVLLKARVNACLEKKKLRDQENLYLEKLACANEEITKLNEQLKAENVRMSAELNIAKKIQQMVLPKEAEIEEIGDLDIAGYMESADEVGGDYYDVICHEGSVKIGIGDVTGHGLESGVLMLMLQTAILTLTEAKKIHPINPIHFLNILNRTIYNNIQRMNLDRHLTLTILDYRDNKITISGQHEKVILIKSCGELEIIDTSALGFYIGLELEIDDFFDFKQIPLEENDVLVLYTDGITEAEDINENLYGIEKICQLVKKYRHLTAKEIIKIVIDDLKYYIGDHKIYDDITLLVLKKRQDNQ